MVGRALGERLASNLLFEALNMILPTRRTESSVNHSEKAGRYTSVAFGKGYEAMGFKPFLRVVSDANDGAIPIAFQPAWSVT